MTATRASLTAKGLLDAAGNVTPAGERWTVEQMAELRRRQGSEEDNGSRRVRWR